MSNWKVIVPEATTNRVLNPSFETTGNFAAAGGATVTRSTSYQKFGLYSGRVQTAGDNEGIDITLGSLANDPHYVSLFVRGTIPPAWDWSLDGATFTSPTFLKSINSEWDLYGLNFPTAQATGSTTLSIYQNGAGAGDFYIDGVQVEQKDGYRTTYCDGTQGGCEWNGAENASTSTRSVLSRAGGRVYDLQDDYALNIGQIVGAGAVPQRLGIDSYAILPGGEFNNLKIESRVFTITGVINATSQADFHDKEQALYNILANDSYPGQPVILQYEGSTVVKQISAWYEGGLESNISATDPCYWERVAIRFNAPDPFWYEIGNSAAVLDTNDSFNPNYILKFDKDTGQWGALAGGPGITITDIAIDERNGIVYACGASAVYSWDGSSWSILGGVANAIVNAIELAPDGTLYAGGSFTTIGAGPVAAEYVAYWDGAAWNAFASEPDAYVTDLVIGLDGILYACGAFANTDDGAAAQIASWDGAAWLALGVGLGAGVPLDMAINPINGNLIVCGGFVNAGGAAVNYIAEWDGSAWSDLNGGANSSVNAVSFSNDGILYTAGSFTTIGSISANYIASWNSTAWSNLGDGINNGANSLNIGPDGVVYVGGSFSEAGGIGIVDRACGWNGYTFFHLGFNLAGTPTVAAIKSSNKKSVSGLYDIYIGMITSAGNTTYTGGSTTITNDGTISFPIIKCHRSGGTSATIQIVLSPATGRKLLLDYDLLDDETLTIDTKPKVQSVMSDFYGDRPDAILANSDLGSFYIPSGNNDIVTFVDVVGAPTITAWMQWRTAYSGY